MNGAVVFLGNICSGKTTLSNHFINKYPWDEISFSKYIKNIADAQNQSRNRENLQRIGYEVFLNTDPRTFLLKVIKFNKPKTRTHVYDSIRHLSILSEVEKYYDKNIIFFIDVDKKILFRRYINKYHQKISYSEFNKNIINHLVEREINELKEKSDFVLDGSNTIDEMILKVESKLVEHDYLDHIILETRKKEFQK
ncbi:MAG: hypothetical protein ABIJ47_09170 [Candidatus Bathyarchaeota archaeon]